MFCRRLFLSRAHTHEGLCACLKLLTSAPRVQNLQAMVPCKAVVRGDSESYIIAAASIIAKVQYISPEALADAGVKPLQKHGHSSRLAG